jgi:hypothetical protein
MRRVAAVMIVAAIASRLSRESGWQVKRVGTRVRNPLTGSPSSCPWMSRRVAPSVTFGLS